jgi:hypothetical protein
MESLMLRDAYDAITRAQKWEWFKTFKPEKNVGFAISMLPELFEIDKYTSYKHTARTYEWTFRQLSVLAENGMEGLANHRGVDLTWDEFVRHFETKPGWEEQAQALRKFEKGQLTYAEMRDLCG